MNLNQYNKFEFHDCAGDNIIFWNNKTVAERIKCFNGGVVFSNRALQPGEIFAIEILDVTLGWVGNLRIGLTQYGILDSEIYAVPKQALPDMLTLAPSWIYGVSETIRTFSNSVLLRKNNVSQKLLVNDDCIETCKRLYSKDLLRNNTGNCVPDVSVGSKVGLFYIPENEQFADVYLIINSVVYGPVAISVPYVPQKPRVIVDVYGNTRKIKIVDLSGLPTLQSICRQVIRANYSTADILYSTLPKPIKSYLNY